MIIIRMHAAPRFTVSSIKIAAICCIVLALPPISFSITTTHYDKAPDIKLQTSEATVRKLHNRLSNLTVAERQKRLLPYINFYLSQNLNQPYNPADERYQILAPSKINSYQPVQTKYSELIGATYQGNKVYEPAQIVYQPKSKFTPFLESNALPGPFVPMVRSQPQKIKISYTPSEQSEKIPNYSAIYDKLSQLKLQQSILSPQNAYKEAPGDAPQYILTGKPQVNFIPVQEYQEQQSDYAPITPQKTYVHTYTPTSIEVPPHAHLKYNHHDYDSREQIPIKIVQQSENKEHLQEEIMIAPEPITVTQINNPKQHLPEQAVEPIRLSPQSNYVPVIAINPHTQYVVEEQKQYHTQNHKQYLQEVIPNGKPILLIPQKLYTQKQYAADAPKQEPLKIAKPIIYLQPTTTQTKPYSAEPIITQTYQPVPIQRLPDVMPGPAPEIQTENPNSLSHILKKLQDSNALPQTLTPENIDNSIKTLVHILSSLKKQQKLEQPIVVADGNEEADYEEDEEDNEAGVGLGGSRGEVPGTITEFYPAHTPEGGTPGRPGVDYPALSSIPHTDFNCKTQRYKGFFADPDTNCQVWHYCDLNGGQASFLCPNGTIFSQVALTCDWWFNVKCSTTTQLYVLNERLYKYIIPLTPKFPEDYTGPLVDKYLALKFREMEEKMKKEKSENKTKEDSNDEVDELQLLEDKNTERSSYTTPPKDEDGAEAEA